MNVEARRRREIDLTKELARRLQRKFPSFRVYANKCPSGRKKIRRRWYEVFKEVCPPLQPEIDVIIFEPQNSGSIGPKLRAIEIKYFEKIGERINQSFYKGIEQALALLQWGFDNVCLWQLFDESLTDSDLRNHGCKTWNYIRDLLDLPIEYTPIKIIGEKPEAMRFQVIQADWLNSLRPTPLLDIDSPRFSIRYTHSNPLLHPEELYERFTIEIGQDYYIRPGLDRLSKEVHTLRKFLIEWLPKQKTGLNQKIGEKQNE